MVTQANEKFNVAQLYCHKPPEVFLFALALNFYFTEFSIVTFNWQSLRFTLRDFIVIFLGDLKHPIVFHDLASNEFQINTARAKKKSFEV